MVPIIWYTVFLLVPISFVIALAFAKRTEYGAIDWTLSLRNIATVSDLLYLKILFRTLLFSALTTLGCFLIGFPCAWSISRSPPKLRIWLTLAIALPSLSNLLIRIYAIQTLVRPGTLIYPFFESGEQSWLLVALGMLTTYLPFMIIPLIVALDRFDANLLSAARDLGATTGDTILHVVLPNIRPAIISGCTMVFIPTMGEYVIPDLLGTAKTMLLGNLITDQFLKARNWPLGSALALALLLLLLIPTLRVPQTVRLKAKANWRQTLLGVRS